MKKKKKLNFGNMLLQAYTSYCVLTRSECFLNKSVNSCSITTITDKI